MSGVNKTMDLRLTNAAVLIAGGSHGLGLAAAEAFGEEGAKVAIGGRDTARLAAAAEVLRSKGVFVWSEGVDISEDGAAQDWTNRAASALGGIDIMVITPSGHCMGSAPSDWSSNLAVDILGSAAMIEAGRPHLADAVERRGDASITLMSSAAAFLSYGPSAYGPLKAGLINLTTGYARLLAPDGIRVNALSPGMISVSGGPLERTVAETPELAQSYLGEIPLGRFGCAAEVGRAVVFLSSPVSAFTSGATLRVDGAMTARVDF